MNFVEEQVSAALQGSLELTALIGARKVFPVKIPQGTVLPCVVYQRYSSAPWERLNGYSSESVVIMVTAFAATYKEIKDIAAIVRLSMSEPPLSAVFRTDSDSYDDESETYFLSMEFVCNQNGGYCHGV